MKSSISFECFSSSSYSPSPMWSSSMYWFLIAWTFFASAFAIFFMGWGRESTLTLSIDLLLEAPFPFLPFFFLESDSALGSFFFCSSFFFYSSSSFFFRSSSSFCFLSSSSFRFFSSSALFSSSFITRFSSRLTILLNSSPSISSLIKWIGFSES